MSSVKLCLIVARARNGAIGKDGDLPWRLSDDLAHFKTTTRGCPVIMGRKTWESLPIQPLPGRDNIVLSRDGQYGAPHARVYTRMPAAIAAARALAVAASKSEFFVVGGEAIYAAALPFADRLYITEVDTEQADPRGRGEDGQGARAPRAGDGRSPRARGRPEAFLVNPGQ